ncbi:helix-turn-helix domain-containing protein [Larkinella humicola]|uniref:Helix-turn-helix transcriptional regulator n=1 Tax=Larkinella humicola TaxID=2607654 RepID=A0A5N1JB78_9BACT|nr:AraC family transcriptional regulator [Larkinella humicola]KAA9349608.1 helix-turn-helix transcriptional regulator [Larkinella humicola]
MNFYFSAYSTPLLFGFIQGWIYAVLLWIRGWRAERLSDYLLGWVLVALCFNIWIYMLGFGGIEILWKELNFFPRTLSFLLPPLYYFYLRSQFDGMFRLRWSDWPHALPFGLDALYHLIVFGRGSDFVKAWEADVHNPYHVDDLTFLANTGQHMLYLYWSFQLYRHYRTWIGTQYSDTDTLSFRWFRNFLLALALMVTIDFSMTVLDLWLNLSFWQDWWNNLAGVVLIYYVSITGYGQRQPSRPLAFVESAPALPDLVPAEPQKPVSAELAEVYQRLLTLMHTEKPYLDAELSLADLARRMKLNATILSQTINSEGGKNFNDFINAYRIDEFKRAVLLPANAHLSLLGVALDCGFNSKATFNRAFKKLTDQSPGEYVAANR